MNNIFKRLISALAVQPVSRFIPEAQLSLIVEGAESEEGDFFKQKLIDLAHLVETMPKTYDQAEKGDQAVVSLHYFFGNSHWYITERDSEDWVSQAFGFVILNGDTECAECGYIDIAELIRVGNRFVELDLYFSPTTLAEIKTEHNIPL